MLSLAREGDPSVSAMVDWDAGAYDQVATPQTEWGRAVMERLELRGDETVLDAGCGTGTLTALLLERLPRGRVIGVDKSPSMVERARETLGADPRVELELRDLLDLELEGMVDAVFSSATFHWILDHERLFDRLHASLRPGGVLETQCGGEGNIAEVQHVLEALGGDERFAQYLRGEARPWNFAGVPDTKSRLRQAGFEVESVSLQSRPVTPSDPRAFLATVILPWHLERLPRELHEQFLDAVLGTVPRPLTLNYVRLNISARRAV
jgi:trans-aconitate 2-methyltransferase